MSDVEIWILAFDRRDETPSEALVRVFGISARAAMEVELSVPVVVKRAIAPSEAAAFVAALEGIGARVEVRPARAASRVEGSLAPGSLEVATARSATLESLPPLAAGSSGALASASRPPELTQPNASFPPVPEWGELPSLDDEPALEQPLILAEVAPARRGSSVPAPLAPLAASASPTARVAPASSLGPTSSKSPEPSPGFPDEAPAVIGQFLTGLVMLGLGAFLASLDGRSMWRIGSLFTLGGGIGTVALATANLVRIFLLRADVWDGLFPRSIAYVVGFVAAALVTFRVQLAPPDDDELVALEAELVAAIEAAPEASDHLRRNPSHRFGSLSTEQSARLVADLGSRGVTSVKVLPDEVYGSTVAAIAVRMPESATQRLWVRQLVWNAVRVEAQANGLVFEDLDVGSPTDEWWTVSLTFD